MGSTGGVAEYRKRWSLVKVAPGVRRRLMAWLWIGSAVLFSSACIAGTLSEYIPLEDLADLLPGADRLGTIEGSPPIARVYSADQQVGYLLLNTDWSNSVGYSGQPIDVLVTLNNDGLLTGARLIDHKEPIVLIGIPETRITEYIDGYLGSTVSDFVSTVEAGELPVDIVSGATVTIMIIDDSIRHAVIKMARAYGVGGLKKPQDTGPVYELDYSDDVIRDWPAVLLEGSVQRLYLDTAAVNAAFAESGDQRALAHTIDGDADAQFIDLYVSLVSIPVLGRSLLGEMEYRNLSRRLKANQHAVLFAANGPYSFKGSGYVRGGVFDRIQLIQGDETIRFRDLQHKRLGDVEAAGAPKFTEVSLFRIPTDVPFDATRSWRAQLLVQRQIGSLEKVFTTFNVTWDPPATFLKPLTAAAEPTGEDRTDASKLTASIPAARDNAEDALWMRIWKSRLADIAVLLLSLTLLTILLFFQDWFVRREKLIQRIRIAFLLFTVIWIGYYANAQLSVVNVLTVGNAFGPGFNWSYFLMDPVIFILWFSVAAALVFWGRGAYCGWLCPFGALQELLNKLAKKLGIPQLQVPFAIHQRLWPFKYVIFLVLFAVSFHAFDLAEKLSEVEPFKTAIILSFRREWPFVLFAVGLLVIGLFIERFYCRYLCPLGAALAIPGRIRVNDWLKRYNDCGKPCQRCASECMVQAIHPQGGIDPNECLYCLHCQELYFDDQRCPVLIKKRLRRRKHRIMTPKLSTDVTQKMGLVQS